MATTKPRVPKPPAASNPSTSAASEIKTLTEAQTADAAGRRRNPRPQVAYNDERAATLPTSIRLSGDELREHVAWLARHELESASLELPSGIVESLTQARQSYGPNRGAAELHMDLLSAFEIAVAYVELCKERGEPGVALIEFAAVLKVLEPARQQLHWPNRYPWIAIATVLHDGIDPRDLPLLLGKPRRQKPSPRAQLARRLTDDMWTDRLRACASLIVGNWPPDVREDEEIDPAEVVKLEQAAMRKARQRRKSPP